jgi:hypothetical protein
MISGCLYPLIGSFCWNHRVNAALLDVGPQAGDGNDLKIISISFENQSPTLAFAALAQGKATWSKQR